MGVGGQLHAPAALPPGKTRYPLYRGLGGTQGQSGRVRKIWLETISTHLQSKYLLRATLSVFSNTDLI